MTPLALHPTSLSVHLTFRSPEAEAADHLRQLIAERDAAEALLDSPNAGLRAWAGNESNRLTRQIMAARAEMKGMVG